MEQNKAKIEQQFLEAYEKYSDAIFRYCWSQTSDREKALDLSQETFTKTWEYLAQGKEILQIKAFLYRVALNAIIDHRRKHKTQSLDAMMEEGFDYQEEHPSAERTQSAFDSKKAIAVISQLDDKYKDVLMMRYAEDMSIKEIADITGESENNISVRIHRGLAKMEDLLKPYEQQI